MLKDSFLFDLQKAYRLVLLALAICLPFGAAVPAPMLNIEGWPWGVDGAMPNPTGAGVEAPKEKEVLGEAVDPNEKAPGIEALALKLNPPEGAGAAGSGADPKEPVAEVCGEVKLKPPEGGCACAGVPN
jgi:hypothetical protein